MLGHFWEVLLKSSPDPSDCPHLSFIEFVTNTSPAAGPLDGLYNCGARNSDIGHVFTECDSYSYYTITKS